jgi:cell wall-associated NlpC family hydrolase
MKMKLFLLFVFSIIFSLPSGATYLYLHNDSSITADTAELSLVDSIISHAMQFEGTPYRSGGCSKDGFDCSGFCSHVFKNFGFELPRTSRDQSTVGEKLAFDEIAPGDLMFFKGSRSNSVGHVALVIKREGDDIWMIHASSIRHKVVVDKFQDLGYYTKRYVGARRIVKKQPIP